MRAKALRHFGWAALLALVTSGCTAADFAMPMGAWDATPNSLVGKSPLGGGGNTLPGTVTNVAGTTTALFQTSIGPVAWKGVQLAQLGNTGTTLLCNAPPDRNNQALAIPTTNLGWAVGYGVARFQSGVWDTEPTDVDSVASPTAPSSQRVILTDVSFAPGSTTDGYAVGTRGTLLRYDALGKRWNKVKDAGLTTENLGTVKVIAPHDVWVAGQVLLHYDGSTWTKVTSVPGEISGLAVVTASNVWASTGDGLYHWDGSIWKAEFTPSGVTVGAPQIQAFGNTIVGLAIEPGVPSGAVFTYQNGAWQTDTVTVPSDIGLDTVVLASQTLAYAKTYDNSGVYRFDLTTKKWSYYSE